MFTVLLGWINTHYNKDYEPIMVMTFFVDLTACILIFGLLATNK